MPIPQNPVYVPPPLIELTKPPPSSGLPFNCQACDSDKDYVVPAAFPTSPSKDLDPKHEDEKSNQLREDKMKFNNILERATVKIVIPSDRALLDLIHKVIEYVIQEGPMFEAIIMTKEIRNPAYRFLFDNQSPAHCYYRWKLYSILHGDDPCEWRTQPFKMFENGSTWLPPPLNPYAEGMPDELLDGIEELPYGPSSQQWKQSKTGKSKFVEGVDTYNNSKLPRTKGSLTKVEREKLEELLRNLDPQKKKIGSSMLFCINHSDAAEEIVECISESLLILETPLYKKIARFYLLSDILHNCSARVTNASYYRKGFQMKLINIFISLREYLVSIEGRLKAEQFKQRILAVLSAWNEWTLYEDDFLSNLKNIFTGNKQPVNLGDTLSIGESKTKCLSVSLPKSVKEEEEDLDGVPLEDDIFSSNRRKATSNYEDDEDIDGVPLDSLDDTFKRSRTIEAKKFKPSKWETVDPEDVEKQSITTSKWEILDALPGEEDGNDDDVLSNNRTTKRKKTDRN